MPSTCEDQALPHQPPNPGGNTWEKEYPEIVFVLPHEPLERYVLGGFHPVTLGDTFCDGRYIVRHKLGHGGYSTVWLAWDGQGE